MSCQDSHKVSAVELVGSPLSLVVPVLLAWRCPPSTARSRPCAHNAAQLVMCWYFLVLQNKVTSVALTRDYDNNIQQHKFPHLPSAGVCCIMFWTCLVDTSITVSSSAKRGIMCDKILGPDTLNVDMGDFVWNNTASCKSRIWNEVQLISVCCPSLHFWLVTNKIFWSWNWRASI